MPFKPLIKYLSSKYQLPERNRTIWTHKTTIQGWLWSSAETVGFFSFVFLLFVWLTFSLSPCPPTSRARVKVDVKVWPESRFALVVLWKETKAPLWTVSYYWIILMLVFLLSCLYKIHFTFSPKWKLTNDFSFSKSLALQWWCSDPIQSSPAKKPYSFGSGPESGAGVRWDSSHNMRF